MAAARYPPTDLRRQVGSPKSSKGSELNRDTPCRNIRIYGRCRYEDSGCTFNHDMDQNSSKKEFTPKKTLNVESLPFTPSNPMLQPQQQKPQHVAASKKSALSAANAAVFTPGAAASSSASAMQPKAQQTKFNVESREFKPQNYESTGNAMVQNNDPFSAGHYNMNSMSPAVNQYSNYSIYAPDQAGLAPPPPLYPQPPAQSFLTPPQYHFYQPGLMDSYRSDLQPYQQTTYDFFIPSKTRVDLTEKMWASVQTMDGLPQLENYHSLFSLDINTRKNVTTFGFPSWLYKAKSRKNGKYYALRRIAGYRLSNERALHAVKDWKKIKNANIVTVHEAFTVRQFHDSSLIFAYDYHPLAKTLHQQHFPAQPPTTAARGPRAAPKNIDEPILWGYICQIANALKDIHSSNLAARCIDLTKIIITSQNRIRLSACSVLDVLQFEDQRPLQELQQEDLLSFGKVILALATNNPNIQPGNAKAAMEGLGTRYTVPFKNAVTWLCTPAAIAEDWTIKCFLSGISGHLAKALDNSFSAYDEQTSILAQELENGRAARLMMKLAVINDRPVRGLPSPNWSEAHERNLLKLFRDYVFHQVDAEGRPVLDIGHMLSCMNKLDAGTDERVLLTSLDNETVIVCTYKEVKQMLNRSFNELMRCSSSRDGNPE
ncbi:PAB-dependent poly(A)-specific ribonuclease subunit PAN3 [Rhypophila decipiens]|uniref:PAN2-PAN3 deadenylation complex subunit PAN3 n=1 Tax=Rhypophila decipiens TaxID=261697 RepID=A0AAN6YAR5_9PEZI|nr:PAB-dependent poly(A)-specific ribonuclease subunit PAN3 [Rhypophila decipiens]